MYDLGRALGHSGDWFGYDGLAHLGLRAIEILCTLAFIGSVTWIRCRLLASSYLDDETVLGRFQAYWSVIGVK